VGQISDFYLGWHSFQNVVIKTRSVTKMNVNFRNVECRHTYTATFSKKRKLMSVQREGESLNNENDRMHRHCFCLNVLGLLVFS